MFENLQDFVAALDRAGELARIPARVSPVLEISAITDRESKRPAPHLPSASARRTDPRFHHLGGRALLFENVEGSDIPVLINAFGSYRRMELALGCHEPDPRGLLPAPRVGHEGMRGFEAWAEILGELVKPQPPSSIGEMIAKAKQLAPLLRMPPKRVRGGPCQEVVWQGDKVDLTRLPLIKCWPLDGDLASVGWPADINDGVAGVEFSRDENFRGRYITLGGIHTIHADDAGNPRPSSRNIGMYRVQLLGKRTMAMHWHVHHDGARHWRSWKKRGEPMPVAIVLGGESVLPYAATAPLPPGLSEILLAGLLHGRGIEMCECVSVPLRVPANAEIVIEGYVSAEAGEIGFDPRSHPLASVRAGSGSDRTPDQSHQFGARTHEEAVARASGIRSLPLPALKEGGAGSNALRSLLGPGAVIEGPFGDHTGFYSLPDRYPILTVTAITMRRHPIYPTTIVGLPPQEDYSMGKATERLFLPLLRTLVPDVVDYDLPMFGAFHNCAVLKIRKEYPLQARRVMHAIWGAGQMAWTKHVIVVDEDSEGKEIDVHDHAAVLRAVGERCDPSRDVETVKGPLDILDHAAPWLGAGTKMGFDATRKWGGAEGGKGGTEASRHRGIKGIEQSRERERAVRAGMQDDLLPLLRPIPGILDLARPAELGGAWLFIKADAPDRVEGRALAQPILAALEREQEPPAFVVLVSPEADIHTWDDALFHWCANSDPGRDRFLSADGGTAVFDATKKTPRGDGAAPVREYPPILRMREDVQRLVDARRAEHGQ